MSAALQRREQQAEILQIGASEAFTGQYTEERQLVEALLGRIVIMGRDAGWAGTTLFEASWQAARDGRPASCTLVLAPGGGSVDVDQVRGFIKDKRDRAAFAASQGSLL